MYSFIFIIIISNKYKAGVRKLSQPFSTCSHWRIQEGAQAVHTPLRVPFFGFDIQNFQNIGTLGVGTAPYLRGWHPPVGNPGSATGSRPSFKYLSL